ncbi:hypothetical protein BEP19_08200 [Ammoniphilus oxalaticus]|uniref:Uncharacterized protein n=1 Tax=Ammoniphilus oxalaticus TaxID=66863 RepID=A0A419SKA2_9BACL|nr:hypothetical protein [Ammoniphilus oxalaticus]RKD24366.1 hypothetical protein BEP19_08200 [Ammoniphilus oxalaticus]
MNNIWDRVNDWKFWALANGQEQFYRLLLENNIHSTNGLVYDRAEPYLSLSIPSHRQLLQEARRLLDPPMFAEFYQDLYGKG